MALEATYDAFCDIVLLDKGHIDIVESYVAEDEGRIGERATEVDLGEVDKRQRRLTMTVSHIHISVPQRTSALRVVDIFRKRLGGRLIS